MEFKLPKRVENSNKSTYGRVVNIAGSDYMPGAAYLSSVSALKVGCGYCFLCSTDRVIDAVAAKTSNVVFVPKSELPNILSGVDVVEIGCGLGTSQDSVKLFSKFLDNVDSSIPVVVDADGLNILADNNIDLLYDFNNKKFSKLVFTPHPKEAARLLKCSLSDVLNNVQESAKKISKDFHCVTVLKTHNTYVCSPDGQEYTNKTGNSSMAKAGSGDVLTGILSGLIAQGMDIYEASCLGVHLHGLSGDFAKEELTEYCVMASDLVSYISNAVKFYLSKEV